MILSHSQKFIFIHVPKAAGSSLDHALAEGMKPGDVRFGPHMLNPEEPRMFAFETKNSLVSEEQWAGYFTFAFVRNPWDRLVSIYRNIIQSYDPNILKQNVFIEDKQFMLDMILKELKINLGNLSFKRFLHDCVLNNRVENPFDYHWKDQYSLVTDHPGQ